MSNCPTDNTSSIVKHADQLALGLSLDTLKPGRP
jgi:hypothetical protein